MMQINHTGNCENTNQNQTGNCKSPCDKFLINNKNVSFIQNPHQYDKKKHDPQTLNRI